MSARHAAIAALALLVLTSLYRFGTLGGALGGFDDDHSMQLAYARQIEAGERPGRDFLGVSLQGVWPPVGFLASAAAQRWLGETLRAEGVLTAGAMGIAAALTVLAASRLAPLPWAIGTTALSVLLAPKLYAFPKVVAFSLAALLITGYARRPSYGRAVGLGVLCVLAFLLRHDYLVYVAVGAAVVFAGMAWIAGGPVGRHAVVCAATAAVLVAPSLLFVQYYGGLGQYLELVRANSAAEAARTTLTLPWLSAAEDPEVNAAIVLFWMVQVVVALALVRGLAVLRSGVRWQGVAIVSLAVMTAVAERFLLRANLSARLGDVGPVLAVLAAVICVPGPTPLAPAWRRIRAAIVVACVTASAVAVGVVGSVASELSTLEWSRWPPQPFARSIRMWRELAELPAAAWSDPNPIGTMLTAKYVNQCTQPYDRLLLLSYRPEVMYFSGRLFAGGVASLVIAGNTPANDEFVLSRILAESVPIVVAGADQSQFLNSTVSTYFPRVHRYLQEAYRDAGTLGEGDSLLHLLVARDRVPARTYPGSSLPCFR